jgi:hypothetical protein
MVEVRHGDKMNARAIALFIDAGPPASRISRWGDAGKGTVSILIDAGTRRSIYVTRTLRLTEECWRTLAYVQDPAMRRMLIEQYRAAGIKIDEEGES